MVVIEVWAWLIHDMKDARVQSMFTLPLLLLDCISVVECISGADLEYRLHLYIVWTRLLDDIMSPFNTQPFISF